MHTYDTGNAAKDFERSDLVHERGVGARDAPSGDLDGDPGVPGVPGVPGRGVGRSPDSAEAAVAQHFPEHEVVGSAGQPEGRTDLHLFRIRELPTLLSCYPAGPN